jgi:hypothetical protein
MGGGSTDPVADVKHIYGKDFGNQYVNPWREGVMERGDRSYYGGDTVAGMHPGTAGAYQGMIDYGQNNPYQGLQLQQGQAGLNSLNLGNQYLQQQMQQGAPQFQFDQGLFDQSMQNLAPAMQGTYNEMTRDNNRMLNEQILPGLDLQQSGSGQMGSSRGDLMAGKMAGMTADRNADIGSQIYQNAANQSFGAGITGGTQNMMGGLQYGQNMLQGAQGLGNVGLPGLGDAYQTGTANLGLGLQGGMGFQNYDQSLINADMARFNYNRDQPWIDDAERMNMLNMTVAPGGTAPGAQPQGPGALGGAMSGFQMAGGLYDAFKPMFGTSTASVTGGLDTSGFGTAADWGY